jgi:hypothetical protein
MWSLNNKVYDFGVKRYLSPLERLWFKGEIREYSRESLNRFKATKISCHHRYIS